MSDATSELPAALQMYQMLFGFQISQALYVIAEHDVATELLGGPREVVDLASSTGADSDALARVIRLLASFGVFRIKGTRVEITDLGRTLADGPADSVRGVARYLMQTHYAPFGNLLHSTRTGEIAATDFLGKPFFEWINDSPQRAEVQNTAMADGGRAIGGDLLESYQLPQGQTVADIGGADGTVLAKLLARQPERLGIVFDLPTVVATADGTLQAAGLLDRVRIVGGDFFASVPSADVYVMSVVLHDWDDAAATRILRNIAAAATPGARLCLVEMVVPEDDSLHFAKLVDITMLAIVGGRERTEMEWRKLLTNGGFTMDRIVAGPSIFSIIEATAI
jgi:O-methyltransferase domain